MAVTMEQLGRKLTTAIEAVSNGTQLKAEIVEVEQDGVTSFRVLDERNKVWIRFKGGSDSQIHEAYNTAVKAHTGLFVFVRKDGLDYYITGLAPKEATDYLEDLAPTFATPDKIFSDEIVAARNYEPGLAVPLHDPAGADADLTITIAPFWYRPYGTIKRWSGGSQDLTDYLPATTGYWRWAWLGIWPYDSSIQVVAGDEYADYSLLTDETLELLAGAMEGLVPSDAVKLQAGATTIERVAYFQHGRLNASETTLATNPITLASLHHHIPANQRAVWYGPITLTGDLILEGELRIA